MEEKHACNTSYIGFCAFKCHFKGFYAFRCQLIYRSRAFQEGDGKLYGVLGWMQTKSLTTCLCLYHNLQICAQKKRYVTYSIVRKLSQILFYIIIIRIVFHKVVRGLFLPEILYNNSMQCVCNALVYLCPYIYFHYELLINSSEHHKMRTIICYLK